MRSIGQTRFPVSALGQMAATVLRDGGCGQVAALFDRSFYVVCNRDWVCIGTEALPMGPLNVRTGAPGAMSWPASGVRLDDRVLIAAGLFHVGGRFAFSYAGAASWRPPSAPDWTVDTLRSGLIACSRLAPDVPAGFPPGLAGPAASRAASAIDTLSSEIVAEAGLSVPAAASVSTLLGMGPGLTPSGDDFLGGMMIALHALGLTARVAELSDVISGCAHARTNPISAAHLGAAAQGAGAEPLHQAINHLLAGRDRRLATSYRQLDLIGHTSGKDALAGAVAVLRSWLGGCLDTQKRVRIDPAITKQGMYHHAG